MKLNYRPLAFTSSKVFLKDIYRPLASTLICLIVGGQVANFGKKLSGSFNYYKRKWSEEYEEYAFQVIAIVCYSGCYVINFETNFEINFSTKTKSQDKNLNTLRKKWTFNMK